MVLEFGLTRDLKFDHNLISVGYESKFCLSFYLYFNKMLGKKKNKPKILKSLNIIGLI